MRVELRVNVRSRGDADGAPSCRFATLTRARHGHPMSMSGRNNDGVAASCDESQVFTSQRKEVWPGQAESESGWLGR